MYLPRTVRCGHDEPSCQIPISTRIRGFSLIPTPRSLWILFKVYYLAEIPMNSKTIQTYLFNTIISLALIIYLTGCNGSSESTSSNEDQPQSAALTLTANPTTVSQNGSTTLTWSSTNTASCSASGGWSGNKGTSGSEVINQLQTDTVFNLTCTGDNGSVDASVSVTVSTQDPASPTVDLTANPTSVSLNGSTTLSWQSNNVESCSASGDWSGSKGTSGEETIDSLTENSTFTLTCNGPDGGRSDTVSVVVNDPAVTVALSAAPTSVPLYGSTTLTWTSSNAQSCTASGNWSGSRATQGEITVDSLTENSTYNLSCSGSGGTAEDSVSVTVDTTALSVNLAADPTSIPSDGSTTLTWESANADNCTASGDWSGSKDLSGTETIDGLTADSQFTLTCSDADGSVSDSVDVTITTGNGTALLSWTPPTQNTDGSTLTNLSGYVIYYGTASGSYTETVTIDNPGLTSYQIDNLTAADWYFVITAMNSSNVESAYSAEVSKTID